MVVDVEHFTPLRAVIGGALIGLSASGFFLAHARIAGISGLLGQLVGRLVNPTVTSRTQWPLTLAFLVGLALAPMLFAALDHPVAVQVDAGTGALILGGLLVGIGTRYAGRTSPPARAAQCQLEIRSCCGRWRPLRDKA